MGTLTLKELQDAVRTGSAARCRVTLQPAGGEGTKVFPPTYAGAVYATEKRRIPGHSEPVDCVLLDSVQSQANRMEEALQQAIDDGTFQKAGISIPLIEVDFTPFWDPEKKDGKLSDELRLIDPVGKISSLQAPHRIADAILRDSVVDEGEDKGKPFRAKNEAQESSFGKRLRRVAANDATALFELCPTALLFGMWDSTGPKGGSGAKFERALVSEIIGVSSSPGVRSSSRIDPLAIQLKAGPLYAAADGNGWTLDVTRARQDKNNPVLIGNEGNPSEANHGNIKPDIKDKKGQAFHGGVTITYADQTTILSFVALRRLRFPIAGQQTSEVNAAGQTVLAALGLCAATLAAESGLDLRSRCLLWPTDSLKWDFLVHPGKDGEQQSMTSADAIKLLKDAIDAAKKLHLLWRDAPLKLRPSDDLVKLVVKSQQLAISTGGGD